MALPQATRGPKAEPWPEPILPSGPPEKTTPEPVRALPKAVGIQLNKPPLPPEEEESSFLLPPDASPFASPAPQMAPLSITPRRVTKLTDVARLVTPPQIKAEAPPAAEVSLPDNSSGVTKVALPIDTIFVEPASSLLEEVSLLVAPEKQPEIPPPVPTPPVAEVQKPEPAPEATKSDAATQTVPLDHLPVPSPEKREFLLTNGERVLGRVLSENGDVIYLEHGTLGILTIPTAQIAKRPVEIVLINGDRIVGDILAETPDTLYVRHASLGMLTVPRAQRSTRVVEAILKDGDRILGELLAETDKVTVIRSATLGTVSVPHEQIALLNRKNEQRELRALLPE